MITLNKEQYIKIRDNGKLKGKLKKKAKKYKVTLSDLIRKKLEVENDEHLFI